MPEPRDAARPGATASNEAPPAAFEQSFARLEETVRALESGKLPLEEAMRLFEQGMVLARRCNELLTAAELKVTRLQSAFAEQMRFLQEDEETSPGDGASQNRKP
jgi:exodeoxyribonuclease VII small subunit